MNFLKKISIKKGAFFMINYIFNIISLASKLNFIQEKKYLKEIQNRY